jgi:IS5 family transposase
VRGACGGRLNGALRAKAAGQKVLRTARVRADTTVIGANVAYPAGCGLLARAVGKLVQAVMRGYWNDPVRFDGGAESLP